MILLMPLATVVIISAVPAPWETGRVIAVAPVESPIVACAHDACREPPAPAPRPLRPPESP